MLRYCEAARHGASARKVFTVPPSWSAKTIAPRGRGASVFHWRTSTPPKPSPAGIPATTTASAFSRGVIAATSASTEPESEQRDRGRDRGEHAATVPLHPWP